MQNVHDLVTTITDEIQVGEQLLDNMSAQRKAILAWNATTLLERLTEKELLLYKLQALTTRQYELLLSLSSASPEQSGFLSNRLSQLPTGPDKAALYDLQYRVREIYLRVQAEEQKLTSLLEHLLGHLGEMFTSLAQAPVHIYRRNGTSAPSRPESELIHGKA